MRRMALAAAVPYLCLRRADALVTEDDSDAALAAAQEGVTAAAGCSDVTSQVHFLALSTQGVQIAIASMD